MARENITTIEASLDVPRVTSSPRVPVMDDIGQGLSNLGAAASHLAQLRKGADVQRAAETERGVHAQLAEAHRMASAADDAADFMQAGARFSADAKKIRDAAIANVPPPERAGFTERTDAVIGNFSRSIHDDAIIKAQKKTIGGLHDGLDDLANTASLTPDPRSRAPIRQVAADRLRRHVEGGWITQAEADAALKGYDANVDRQSVINAAKADPAAARALLDKKGALPNLPAAEREELSSAVDNMAAINKAAGRAQLESGLKQLNRSLADGRPPDPKLLASLRDLAVTAGNDPAVAAVDAVQKGVGYARNLAQKPLNEAAAEVGALAGLTGMGGAPPTARGALAYLQRNGLSQHAAIGLTSRFLQESNLNTGARGDYRQGHPTAFGIGQWRGERFAALKSFASARGKPWTDFETQLGFALHELSTSEKAAGDRLRGAADLDQAIDATYDYERPAASREVERGYQLKQVQRITGGRDVAGRTGLPGEYPRAPGAEPTDPETTAKLAYGQAQVRAMREALDKDPIAYMRTTGLMDVPPLDLTDLPESLAARAAQARTIARFNDIPVKFFDAAEVKQLGDAMKGADPDTKAVMIGAMTGAFGTDTISALRQLGEKGDAPVEAHLGALYAASADREPVMRAAFWGLKALNDKAVTLPEARKLEAVEAATLGNALDPRLTRTRSSIVAAARAIYANAALRKGLTTFSEADYQDALEAAVGKQGEHGGIIEWGPGKVILPLKMSEADFIATTDALTPRALIDLSVGGGAPVHITASGKTVEATPDDIKQAKLITVGDGRYRVSLTDPAQGPAQFLIDAKTGGYYELDLGNGPPEIEIGRELVPDDEAKATAQRPVTAGIAAPRIRLDIGDRRSLEGRSPSSRERLPRVTPGSLLVPEAKP